MVEHIGEDLRGSRFEHVVLADAEFRNVDLSGARITNSVLVNVEITGDIENLHINGVDVVPLVEAVLDQRYPERARLRPSDAAGFREGWALVEQLWVPTVERARHLAPELLHERVHGEWSFIETLRHLVFATDAWVKRALLADPEPYDVLDLPHTDMGDVPGVPNDLEARPSLDEVLVLRADRMAVVRDVMAGLTDERLASHTEPVPGPGYPLPARYAVRRCLLAVLNEESAHRRYAERDLAVLEG